jgi:antitoxin (DNA-binding transcriptional repressor) of toxin-antitoxin stability system
MKFIPSRDLRVRPGEVWNDLRREDALVVTSHGQPIALMVPVTGEDLEAKLRMLRQARLQETVRQIQRSSVDQDLQKTSQRQIDAEIRKARGSARR